MAHTSDCCESKANLVHVESSRSARITYEILPLNKQGRSSSSGWSGRTPWAPSLGPATHTSIQKAEAGLSESNVILCCILSSRPGWAARRSARSVSFLDWGWPIRPSLAFWAGRLSFRLLLPMARSQPGKTPSYLLWHLKS